jgi:hypothetical protein
MGINLEFDLWNYFFRLCRLQDLDMGLIVSRGVVIHVKSGHGVEPYFDIPMPRSLKGWRRKWFYMKNDASAPLPTFTSCRPVPPLS